MKDKEEGTTTMKHTSARNKQPASDEIESDDSPRPLFMKENDMDDVASDNMTLGTQRKPSEPQLMTEDHDDGTQLSELPRATRSSKLKKYDNPTIMRKNRTIKAEEPATDASSSMKTPYSRKRGNRIVGYTPRHNRLEQQKLAGYDNIKKQPSDNDGNREDDGPSIPSVDDEARTQVPFAPTTTVPSKGQAHSKRRGNRSAKTKRPQNRLEQQKLAANNKNITSDMDNSGIRDNTRSSATLDGTQVLSTTVNITRNYDNDEEESVESVDEIHPGAVRVLGMQHPGIESTRDILMDDIHQEQTLQQHSRLEQLPSVVSSATGSTFQGTESSSSYNHIESSVHPQGSTSSRILRMGRNDSQDVRQGGDSIKVVAELAPDEEDIAQQVQAQVADQSERERKKQVVVEAEELEEDRTKKILLAILFLLVVTGGTLLVLYLSGVIGAKDVTEAPTSSPSVSPTTAPTNFPTRYEQLVKLLVGSFEADEEVLRDNSTDQYQALIWLADEDSHYNDSEFDGIDIQRLAERYSLAVLYRSLNGSSWNESYNFLSNTSVCEWHGNGTDDGVTCLDGEEESDVTKLNMAQNNLVGSLPSELALLTSAKHINLNGNDFSKSTIPTEMFGMSALVSLSMNECSLGGTIPSIGISQMTSLTSMDLGRNTMTGSLPTEMGLLTSMVDLRLDDNRFLSFFPTEFGMLQELTRLHLFGNFLLGFLPSEVGEMTAMIDFQLRSNFFFGGLPSEIGGGMTALTVLDMTDSGLSGTIPTEVGQLAQLSTLWLGSNDFTGTLPTELRLLTSLESLQLGNNQLTSAVSTALDALPTRLTELYLNNNQFSSSVPSGIGRMTLLTDLRLGNNGLTGTIPFETSQLRSMRILHLDNTDISGSLPPSFRNLETITELRLNSNRLAGNFPFEIFSMEGLQILDLSFNGLTGSLPTEIGTMKALQSFDLSSNDMNDRLPSEIGLMESLQELFLSRNSFIGAIPSEVGMITILQTFYLTHNRLTGSIPSEVGLMKKLETFNLEENGLGGSLPTELGSMASLEELDLGGNFFLGGTIPSEFGMIRSIRSLDLSNNDLTGTIPSNVGTMTDLQALDLNRNRLSGAILAEVSLMTSLQILDLSGNGLSFTIPSEIFLIGDLRVLFLGANFLSGTVPTEVGMTEHLRALRLELGRLSGTIPSEVGNLINLQELNLYANVLTGSIPSQLGLMTSIERLVLALNFLDGSLPSELGKLTTMSSIELDENLFTGTLPTQFGALAALRRLWLNGQYIFGCANVDPFGLSGSLPTELAQLAPTVEYLRLSGHNFEGTLPTEYGLFTNLFELSLNGNSQLFGSIPIEWSALNAGTLNRFNLQGTNITGNVNHVCPVDSDTGSFIERRFYTFECTVGCSCCTECCDRNEMIQL